jgi:hypothetical protein
MSVPDDIMRAINQLVCALEQEDRLAAPGRPQHASKPVGIDELACAFEQQARQSATAASSSAYAAKPVDLECALEQEHTTAELNIAVPRGALYGPEPPLYPREGKFCFPTGMLLASAGGLATALGWPLQRVRMRRCEQQQQQQQWRCRCCRMIVKVHVGPFLTTVTVSARSFSFFS